jgi:hypothetical protein
MLLLLWKTFKPAIFGVNGQVAKALINEVGKLSFEQRLISEVKFHEAF